MFSLGIKAENVFAFPFDLYLPILRYFKPFCGLQFPLKPKLLCYGHKILHDFFITYIYLVMGVPQHVWVCKSEDNLKMSVCSFQNGGHGDQTQDINLGSKDLYLPSYLTGLGNICFILSSSWLP